MSSNNHHIFSIQKLGGMNTHFIFAEISDANAVSMSTVDFQGKDTLDISLADYEYAKARADIDLLNNSALLIAKKVANKDAERLHDICNELLLYRSIDESVVDASEKIAKMAVDNQPNVEYLLTYSKILSVNNKNKKAIKTAEKALKMAEGPKQADQIEEWILSLQTK